jgi:hypothetical protein
LDVYADTADIPVTNQPYLYGMLSELFIGNDGFLYQYGRVITADDISEFFVGGNMNSIGLSFPMGPITAPISANVNGASIQTLPFDLTVENVFTVDTRINVAQPDLTVNLIHSSLDVYQGMNGNTASQ